MGSQGWGSPGMLESPDDGKTDLIFWQRHDKTKTAKQNGTVSLKKGATPNKADSNDLWKMYMNWNDFEDQ